MSQTLASSPFDSLRRAWARTWNEPDSRSVAIGLLGMLLVHLLVYLVAPHLLRSDGSMAAGASPAEARQFNIEIAPDAFTEPEEKPQPTNFVETNPDAPDNVPDRTNNFGAQNQQVAQEIPSPDETNDRPETEGRTDIESSQIVSGSLNTPVETMPAVPPAAEEEIARPPESPPKQEQIPLSGFEKLESESEEAFGSNVAKIAEGAQNVPEYVEGMRDVPLVPGATGSQPQIDPKRPRPRPQVVKQQQVRPAVFQENKFGTKNVGLAAWDARWSNYGQYLQKLIDTVQIQWERILIESRVYPVNGTNVTVVFKLNSKGQISRIVSVEGTAGNQAEKACASAITSRSPYGPWTDDMVAMLGEEQELTFNFYYQ